MPAQIDLTGHVAWVTGGASGIGAAIAATLNGAGARVVSLDCTHEEGDVVRDGIVCSRLDVRRGDDVRRVVRTHIDAGVGPDLLVNAAGITHDGVVWKLTDEDWADVIDVNLTGAFRMVRACAPYMRACRRGAIVNVASINALRGKFGQSNYAASKGGLVAFTRAIATELAREGIRVNAVAPGMIDTPMTRALGEEVRARAAAEAVIGRIGSPQDVANAALFLASPLASHITGHVLVVDGGQML